MELIGLVRRKAYVDSVALMRVSDQLRALPGVLAASAVMATDLNRELLDSARGKELVTRTPMARFGTVEEVVGAAIFLASDESAFTTGQIVAVDGGFLASGVNQ